MKSIQLISTCLILILLLACSKDDDDDKGPDYSFEDQVLQGLINKQSFSFVDGYATEGLFGDEEFRFRLGMEELEDPCQAFSVGDLTVIFSLPSEVGVYPLMLDFNTGESQTITLFDASENLNIGVSTGAVEILSISDTEIKGRIDGRFDDENHVNGNFTVAFCEE